MSSQKLLNLMGLAQRAGKLVSGDSFEASLNKGQVELVFLAQDASPRTKKQVKDKSSYRKVPVYEGFSAQTLSLAIGKGHRVVVGVTDLGFAKKMITYIKEEEVTQ